MHDPSLFLWRVLCLPNSCLSLADGQAILRTRLAIRYLSSGFHQLAYFADGTNAAWKSGLLSGAATAIAAVRTGNCLMNPGRRHDEYARPAAVAADISFAMRQARVAERVAGLPLDLPGNAARLPRK